MTAYARIRVGPLYIFPGGGMRPIQQVIESAGATTSGTRVARPMTQHGKDSQRCTPMNRAWPLATLFIALATTSAEAVTLTAARSTVDFSLSMSGLPAGAPCQLLGGPNSYATAGKQASATARSAPAPVVEACSPDDGGALLMRNFNPGNSTEAGLEMRGNSYARARAWQYVTMQVGGREGLELDAPLTLFFDFSVDYSLHVESHPLDALPGDPIRYATRAQAEVGARVQAISLDGPFEYIVQDLFQKQLVCVNTVVPCVDDNDARQFGRVELRIPRAGRWLIEVLSDGGNVNSGFNTGTLPEGPSLWLMILGLVAIALSRRGRAVG